MITLIYILHIFYYREPRDRYSLDLQLFVVLNDNEVNVILINWLTTWSPYVDPYENILKW